VCESRNAIWIVSLEGEERLLLDGVAVGLEGILWPDWSADGQFVYFTARDSAGTEDLYTVPVDGGIPRKLVRFDDPTRRVSASFSLGTDRLYFSLMESESDIYVMDLEMQ